MTETIKADFTRPLANPNNDHELAGVCCIYVDFSENRKAGSTVQDVYRVMSFTANGNDCQEDFSTPAEANAMVNSLLRAYPDLKRVFEDEVF